MPLLTRKQLECLTGAGKWSIADCLAVTGATIDQKIAEAQETKYGPRGPASAHAIEACCRAADTKGSRLAQHIKIAAGHRRCDVEKFYEALFRPGEAHPDLYHLSRLMLLMQQPVEHLLHLDNLVASHLLEVMEHVCNTVHPLPWHHQVLGGHFDWHTHLPLAVRACHKEAPLEDLLDMPPGVSHPLLFLAPKVTAQAVQVGNKFKEFSLEGRSTLSWEWETEEQEVTQLCVTVTAPPGTPTHLHASRLSRSLKVLGVLLQGVHTTLDEVQLAGWEVTADVITELRHLPKHPDCDTLHLPSGPWPKGCPCRDLAASVPATYTWWHAPHLTKTQAKEIIKGLRTHRGGQLAASSEEVTLYVGKVPWFTEIEQYTKKLGVSVKLSGSQDGPVTARATVKEGPKTPPVKEQAKPERVAKATGHRPAAEQQATGSKTNVRASKATSPSKATSKGPDVSVKLVKKRLRIDVDNVTLPDDKPRILRAIERYLDQLTSGAGTSGSEDKETLRQRRDRLTAPPAKKPRTRSTTQANSFDEASASRQKKKRHTHTAADSGSDSDSFLSKTGQVSSDRTWSSGDTSDEMTE